MVFDDKLVQNGTEGNGLEAQDSTQWTPETKLKSILDCYPNLKERMVEVHPNFKLLQTPLANLMLPKATLAMLSERSGLSFDELVEKIRAIL